MPGWRCLRGVPSTALLAPIDAGRLEVPDFSICNAAPRRWKSRSHGRYSAASLPRSSLSLFTSGLFGSRFQPGLCGFRGSALACSWAAFCCGEPQLLLVCFCTPAVDRFSSLQIGVVVGGVDTGVCGGQRDGSSVVRCIARMRVRKSDRWSYWPASLLPTLPLFSVEMISAPLAYTINRN